MPDRFDVARALILLIAVSAAAGCGGTSGPDVVVPTGTYGGTQALVTVTGAGAHIEFSCAGGDITQPLMADSNGEFSVDGVYFIEAGPTLGPRQPARYTGRIDNQTMTLGVTLAATSQTVGSFVVKLGTKPSFVKCL